MPKPASIAAWLEELGKPAADRDYKPGHARMQALLRHLKLQQPALRVRIAGTNGKGSTAHMLAAALQTAGLNVGLYTSPHLLRFNERIRINGRIIDDEALHAGLSRLMPLARSCGASYFEVATALALDYFSAQQVHAEILEAGVGARLDATTAVPADVALITPIAPDHQAWLGDTLVEIAAEKAHVTNGCRLTLSAPQTPEVAGILRHACPDIEFVTTDAWQGSLHAAGAHQRINAALAWKACQRLSETLLPHLNLDAARAAIGRCSIPGRLQHLRIGAAHVWLDAAHNRHAIEALLPGLAAIAGRFDTILVRTREDRSLADALPLLAPLARELVHVKGPVMPALQDCLERYPQGRFLVLGSFTTVAEVLQALGNLPLRV